MKEPHNAGVPHNAGLDIEFHKTHPNHLKLNILVPTYIKTCIEDFLVGIFDHFDLLNVWHDNFDPNFGVAKTKCDPGAKSRYSNPMKTRYRVIGIVINITFVEKDKKIIWLSGFFHKIT